MRRPSVFGCAKRLPHRRRREPRGALLERTLARPRPFLQLPPCLLRLGRLLRLPLQAPGARHPEDYVLALVGNALTGRADEAEAARAVELLRRVGVDQIPVRVPAHPPILAPDRPVSRTVASSGDARTHASSQGSFSMTRGVIRREPSKKRGLPDQRTAMIEPRHGKRSPTRPPGLRACGRCCGHGWSRR